MANAARPAGISGPSSSRAQNPVKSRFLGSKANTHLNCSLRNHKHPIEMKHHPARLAGAWMFGVHGNVSQGCEHIGPTLRRFTGGGWAASVPRLLRTKGVTDFQFKTRKTGQVGHLTPELDLERRDRAEERFFLTVKCQGCAPRVLLTPQAASWGWDTRSRL